MILQFTQTTICMLFVSCLMCFVEHWIWSLFETFLTGYQLCHLTSLCTFLTIFNFYLWALNICFLTHVKTLFIHVYRIVRWGASKKVEVQQLILTYAGSYCLEDYSHCKTKPFFSLNACWNTPHVLDQEYQNK